MAYELDQDIFLDFRSVQGYVGRFRKKRVHAGFELRYLAAQRVVIRKTWGGRMTWWGGVKPYSEQERLRIPASVTTKEALRRYIRQKKGWDFDLRDTDDSI